MNLQEIMNQITMLGGQIRAAAASLAQAANNPVISMDEITRQQQALKDLQDRQAALQASYDTMMAGHQGGLQPAQPQESRSRREMRASNEYARAFAYALKNGINRRNGRGNENVRVLFDALTEGGGDPAGEDGGFLVPVDIDNQIREIKRQLNPLSDLFNVENVTAPTGWRVMDTAPTTGMSAVEEMASVPTNDQPLFVKIPYTLGKYGLIVPVSNELLSDEVANLMAYLSRWFAKKQVLTENGLLITALKTLTASALTPATTGADALDGVKAVLNKVLDPAISVGATILTNQNGFDALDQLKDEEGRGLLQPDPVNPTQYRVYGRNVRVLSNAQMPDIAGAGSDPDTTDFFIGDFREFATLFQKDALEVASTDIGGNAWRTDSTEIRGIARMAVSKFDTGAVVRRNI